LLGSDPKRFDITVTRGALAGIIPNDPGAAMPHAEALTYRPSLLKSVMYLIMFEMPNRINTIVIFGP
jgi:hypothetical protein